MGKHSKIELIPHVSVNPGYLAFYDLPTDSKNRTEKQIKSQQFLEDNETNGIISKKAASNIHKVVTWFTALAKEKQSEYEKRMLHYKLTFVTLTLPSKQVHSDEFIKRNCLNRFLIQAKRDYNLHNYFWRAEAQENGNIHFHILIDKFIHYEKLRLLWNSILNDYGYIEQYRNKMKEFFKHGFILSNNIHDKRTPEQQLKAYEKGKEENFSNPNSTDIHAIKEMKNVTAYISKYCSKNNKYFQAICKDAKTTAQQMRKIRGVFGIVVKGDKVNFMMKLEDIPTGVKIEPFLNEYSIEFISAREKKIREISGRLWYASDSVRKLKNISFHITMEVQESIQYIVDNAKGKFIKVSDYCTIFVCDFFNQVFDPDRVKGFFDKLLPQLTEFQLNLVSDENFSTTNN